MRIDVHHHMLPAFYREALVAAGLDRSLGIRFPPPWRPEESLAVMDRHGVDGAALSVSVPGVAFGGPALARRVNEWAADLAAAHPGRFAVFASLPLGDGTGDAPAPPGVDVAVEEAAHALDVLGLDGVALFSSAGGRYLGDAVFDPLLEELDRRRAVAFVHPTVPPGGPPPGLDVPVFAVEFVADTTRAVANLVLSGALERFPNVAFVVAHAGGFAPYVTTRLEAAWARGRGVRERAPAGPLAYLRRLAYDIAASANPYTLPAVLALAGPERVLLGTDWPFVAEAAVAETVAGTARLVEDPGARRLVEGGNAARLLPRLGGAGARQR